MKLLPSSFEEVLLIEPTVQSDYRGFFMESYQEKRYQEAGIPMHFVQENHSLSESKGTLRGMHYQLNPYAQSKLVRVLSGEIYDVVLDMRKNSPTYGKWEGFLLSEGNKRQLLVPKGFAHGFCTLTPHVNLLYKTDAYYHAAADRGVRWNDPEVGIKWPVESPILSVKDQQSPLLREAENNFEWGGTQV